MINLVSWLPSKKRRNFALLSHVNTRQWFNNKSQGSLRNFFLSFVIEVECGKTKVIGEEKKVRHLAIPRFFKTSRGWSHYRFSRLIAGQRNFKFLPEKGEVFRVFFPPIEGVGVCLKSVCLHVTFRRFYLCVSKWIGKVAKKEILLCLQAHM